MTERRAEPRRRRLHRGDSGQHANVEIAPGRLALSTASKTADAIANTPGSPPDTTATDAPRPRATAPLRAIQLDAIVAGEPRLAGALRHARDIGRVADNIFRLLQRGAGVMRQKTRVAGAEPNDIEPAFGAPSWPPSRARRRHHREIRRVVVELLAKGHDFFVRHRAAFDIDARSISMRRASTRRSFAKLPPSFITTAASAPARRCVRVSSSSVAGTTVSTSSPQSSAGAPPRNSRTCRRRPGKSRCESASSVARKYA